mgnify:CR=1 FL=1
MNSFVKINDPSHGWLVITNDQLKKFRMNKSDFTDFSYHSKNGEIIYLEEDKDMPKFLNKLDSMNIQYQIQEKEIEFDSNENPRNLYCRDIIATKMLEIYK